MGELHLLLHGQECASRGGSNVYTGWTDRRSTCLPQHVDGHDQAGLPLTISVERAGASEAASSDAARSTVVAGSTGSAATDPDAPTMDPRSTPSSGVMRLLSCCLRERCLQHVSGRIVRLKDRSSNSEYPALWNPELAEPRLALKRSDAAEILSPQGCCAGANAPNLPGICNIRLPVGYPSRETDMPRSQNQARRAAHAPKKGRIVP